MIYMVVMRPKAEPRQKLMVIPCQMEWVEWVEWEWVEWEWVCLEWVCLEWVCLEWEKFISSFLLVVGRV